MSGRKCRIRFLALYYSIATALVFMGPLFGDAGADEIDSIRNMPTSAPEEITYKIADGPAGVRSENSPAEYFAVGDIGVYGTDADEPWTWQMLPQGLIFRSYLAGGREPRFGAQWVRVKDKDWLWDGSLGARLGLVRYGTQNPFAPQGWELDVEGAAFPRLTLDNQRDMVSADYRFGIPLTYRIDRWQYKFAFYHLSSHLADEYMLHNTDRERLNYSRDALTFAVGFFPDESWRLYAECGWAWYTDGGSRPWEFNSASNTARSIPTDSGARRFSPSTPASARKSITAAT
jgi:hypothetical protein